MPLAVEKPAIKRQLFDFSIEQYHALSKSGLISEKTELLKGQVVNTMSKTPLHTRIVENLFYFFQKKLPESFYIRMEQPLTFPDSEPEPDIAIVYGQRKEFRRAHPSHCELVIEVAISTVDIDREKTKIYSEASIPICWLILPEKQIIEVYSQPVNGVYSNLEKIESSSFFSFQLAAVEYNIDCSEIF